ncbi:MAG: VWA domain-containing protein, partial [Pseudomonadota bacterium]
RRTQRTTAGLGGVPFQLHWKQTVRERAKIVVICDVSNSVAQYVRFLLLLSHSLGDAIDDLRAFAFSARLGEITDLLDTDGFEGAMETILRAYGMGSTDYGQALSDLSVKYANAIDRRTTVIILGDGRSNHGDPRMDLFRELTARSKRTIWLSPEPETMWGTGDSELLRYKPHCYAMGRVSTLNDLERTLDRVLASYQ